MSQISNKNLSNQNFTKPEVFTQQLETLKGQFISVLEDFKQDFINYNINPQNSEYQQTFFNDKNNLTSIDSSVLQLSQSVETTTNQMNEKLILLNKLIKQIKEENKQLKIRLGIVENKNNAADEMIDNYKQMYETGYLRNVALGLSIVVSCLVISKVYTGSINVNVSK